GGGPVLADDGLAAQRRGAALRRAHRPLRARDRRRRPLPALPPRPLRRLRLSDLLLLPAGLLLDRDALRGAAAPAPRGAEARARRVARPPRRPRPPPARRARAPPLRALRGGALPADPVSLRRPLRARRPLGGDGPAARALGAGIRARPRASPREGRRAGPRDARPRARERRARARAP